MRKPVVLLLGDSISLGYRRIVQRKLADYVSVLFPFEQGKGIADIYRMLYEWNRDLIENPSNVKMVYWNAGLWDVVDIFNEGENTPIDIYKEYLLKTCRRLRKLFPKACICFASTTPVLEKRYGVDFKRSNEVIKRYNEMAYEVLNRELDLYDDLFAFLKGAIAEEYVDATHFGNAVNSRIAEHICKTIFPYLDDDITAYQKQSNKLNDRKDSILSIVGDKKRVDVIAWGAGNIFIEYEKIISEYCNIQAIVDKDIRLQGSNVTNYRCISPDDIPSEIDIVVITIDDNSAINEIKDYCLDRGIICCTYLELLDHIWPVFERNAIEAGKVKLTDADPFSKQTMTKYVGINISENTCNLDCLYCYLQLDPYRRSINLNRKNPHIAKFIRWRLSKDNLGGSCLIGITGSGETFYADGLEELCIELLKEGHYLHIVTNGLLTSKIQSLIVNAGEYAKNIIFKLSFHYLELLRRGLLEQFVETVRTIEQSYSSYTIELMPHDELVPYIDDVIEFSKTNFGALPQLTIGRDDGNKAKLLTEMRYDEYVKTFGIFKSEMFDIRMKMYFQKGRKCQAGSKSFFFDLYTGHINRCLFHEDVGNLYYDGIDKLELLPVGDYCKLDYCFNCHVYATLGIVPVDDVPSYMTIRDRTMINGHHWIKEDMRRYLDVKL